MVLIAVLVEIQPNELEPTTLTVVVDVGVKVEAPLENV